MLKFLKWLLRVPGKLIPTGQLWTGRWRGAFYAGFGRQLFNSIRDAILVTDTDRNIVDCNTAFTDLFGYSITEIRGEDTSLIYADDAVFEKMGEDIQNRLAFPSFVSTVTCKKKSGDLFTGEETVFLLRNQEGENSGFIGMIREEMPCLMAAPSS